MRTRKLIVVFTLIFCLIALSTFATAQDPNHELRLLAKLQGFDLPETIVYDDQSNAYLVSNMAGHPTKRNNSGFISRITAEGFEVDRRAIVGTQDCPLHAPKGMAIVDEVLYVADVDAICLYDLAENEWIERKVIENAIALNDIAVNQEGEVCLSDPKLLFDDEMESRQVDSSTLFLLNTKSNELRTIPYPDKEQPNRLETWGNDFLVAPLIGEHVMRLDSQAGQLTDWTGAPAKLDGIERQNENSILVSSLADRCVYKLQPGEEPQNLLDDLSLPGNFCFDRTHRRLIIPLIGDGEILIFEFKAEED